MPQPTRQMIFNEGRRPIFPRSFNNLDSGYLPFKNYAGQSGVRFNQTSITTSQMPMFIPTKSIEEDRKFVSFSKTMSESQQFIPFAKTFNKSRLNDAWNCITKLTN